MASIFRHLTGQTMPEKPPPLASSSGFSSTYLHPQPGQSKAEPPPPEDKFPSATNPPKHPRKEDTVAALKDQIKKQNDEISRLKEERERDTTKIKEVSRLQREVAGLEGQIEKQRAEVSRSRGAEEELKGRVRRKEDSISQLNHLLEKTRNGWQEANRLHARQTEGMQDQLKRTEELLAARSAELSGAQVFLSTADRLSEMEVLDIVGELNQNIYQVAAGLTDEWMKMEPSKPPARMELSLASQQRPPVLTQLDLTFQQRPLVLDQLARNGDLTGLTFLIQLYLCYYATVVSSSWAHEQNFVPIKDLYQRLSASEEQAVSARWRSLAHSYLSAPPPNAEWLAGELAKVLDKTGSFHSPEESIKFVQTAVLERIEEMIQTAHRLEKVFMVDITSCDMSLIFHPSGPFDDAKMTNEFGVDSVAMPGKQERIAGTIEVGVQKSVFRKPGEPRHVAILLMPKVVLERDVVGDGK